MAFCPFLSFKPKHSGTIYDDTGSSILPTDGFSVGAVFVPDEYPSNFITDSESSDFDSDGFFVCPHSARCQMWAGTDCGLKSPAADPASASAASLLNEFLNGSDQDGLDLTPLGVLGTVYGVDFYIDDPDNIPTLLQAAHDHPNFDVSGLIDTIDFGRCEVTIDQAGNDSTDEWIYDVTITDSTSDFITAGVEDTTSGDGMYIVIDTQGAFQIDFVDSGSSLTLRLGYSDDPPLTEGTYSFKVNPKSITWDDYLSLFS